MADGRAAARLTLAALPGGARSGDPARRSRIAGR
jgi:hypothetical protein